MLTATTCDCNKKKTTIDFRVASLGNRMLNRFRWVPWACSLVLIGNFIILRMYGDTLRSTFVYCAWNCLLSGSLDESYIWYSLGRAFGLGMAQYEMEVIFSDKNRSTSLFNTIIATNANSWVWYFRTRL